MEISRDRVDGDPAVPWVKGVDRDDITRAGRVLMQRAEAHWRFEEAVWKWWAEHASLPADGYSRASSTTRNSVMRGLFLWLLLLPAIPAIAQEKSEAQFETYVSGTIDVAKDGAVSGYTLEDGVNPAIRAAIDKNVRSWRFEPITVDGRAVVATTQMNLQLVAVPVDNGDYGLRVEKAWFGDPQRSNHIPAPAYPADAAKAGRQAKVVLVLRLDPQGNVVEAFPEQTSLDIAPGGKKAQYWRKRFEEASIRAAMGWKFTVTEIIDGQPIGGSVRVPVSYAFGPQEWGKYVAGPINPVPWKSDAKVAEKETASLQDGQAQSLDSRFKLKTEVIGSML